MIFKEYGSKDNPTIIFIHGGGLSCWSWNEPIRALGNKYRIIAPILDGHGNAFDKDFQSIERSAEDIIEYIERNLGGKVFALCGLSIGAQIIVDILFKKPNMVEYAVIESALIYPMKTRWKLIAPIYSLFHGLIKMKWYAKLQAKVLGIPENLFEDYFRDNKGMSKKSLMNMIRSNMNYSIPDKWQKVNAKTMIIVGKKEAAIMKKSARKLHETIENSTLLIIDRYGHGELSLANPDKYIKLLQKFFNN